MLRPALIIAVTALVTILLRLMPFVLFAKHEPPRPILKLGRLLPCAAMGMLVVFCLRSTDLSAPRYGLPEAIACAVVILLHLFKRNSLLSILGGTVCYMLLVQLVF